MSLSYILIRSNRRTVGIRILHNGQVEVRTPKRLPVKEIEKLLYEKEAWIHTHRNAVLARTHISLEFGTKIPFLGIPRRIIPSDENTACLTDTGICLPAALPPEAIPENIIRLYIAAGKQFLTVETERLAEKYGCTVTSITVNRAKKRWGSCTVNSGRIHYSWRLMCVPPEAIAYVITHELAHLNHPDHSAAFWQQVKAWLPAYETGQRILTEYEKYLMTIEGL